MFPIKLTFCQQNNYLYENKKKIPQKALLNSVDLLSSLLETYMP